MATNTTGVAAVTNTDNSFHDANREIINSAEVEQETEQENECADFAICANVIGVKLQTGAAAITNTGNSFDDGLSTVLK